jgi:hypothetical protein
MTEYTKLKEEALHHSLQKIHFGRGYGPAVRQTTERNKTYLYFNKEISAPHPS